jgi:hypothetical protein
MFSDDAECAWQTFRPIRSPFVMSSEVETSLDISSSKRFLDFARNDRLRVRQFRP